MTAKDALSGEQFPLAVTFPNDPEPAGVSGHARVSDILNMKSRDHPGTVSDAIKWMHSPERIHEMDAKWPGDYEGHNYLIRQSALARDVAKNGVRQPVRIRHDDAGDAMLWDGHHRVWAAQTTGHQTVPFKVESE